MASNFRAPRSPRLLATPDAKSLSACRLKLVLRPEPRVALVEPLRREEHDLCGTYVASPTHDAAAETLEPKVDRLTHALAFGALVSSALALGGALGAFWKAPRRITGILLAFASGTLIAALAFELFPEAVKLGGLPRAGFGLLTGAVVFVAINTWLDRKSAPRAASGEKAEQHQVVEEASQRAEASPSIGLALLASVILDGVPENLALGVSLQVESSVTLLVAIFASNLPEALVSAIAMRAAGRSRRFVISIWGIAALVLTAVVVAGRVAGDVPVGWLSFLMAVAGGAVLASLADTLMPEAFERGRPLNALATAAGFFVSFWLAGG